MESAFFTRDSFYEILIFFSRFVVITIFCETVFEMKSTPIEARDCGSHVELGVAMPHTFKCAAICPHLFTSIFRVFREKKNLFFPLGGINVERQTVAKNKVESFRDVVQAGSHRQTYPKHVYLTWGSLSGQIDLSQRLYAKNGIDIAHSLECFTPAASTFSCSSAIALLSGRVWLVGETFHSFLFAHFPTVGKMHGFSSCGYDFFCYFSSEETYR